MSVLVANDVSVRRGDHNILQGVDFALESGEMVGLIGPNGAGKTTLLKCLVDLITPATGTVMLNEQSIKEFKRHDISKHIAYLAQDAGVHWPLSVERVVGLGRLPHGGTFGGLSAADQTAIEAAMTATDIIHLRDRKATTLSGGERIRMLLASSLAVGAPLLLADEPVSGLDPGHQIQLMQLLRDHVEGEKSAIVVLHDLTLAVRYCSRIVLMANGRVVANGPPAEVLTSANLADVYGIQAHIEGNGDGKIIVPTGLAQAPIRTEPDASGKRSA